MCSTVTRRGWRSWRSGDVDLTFLSACGFTAFGVVIGALAEERMWWLLNRVLPRRVRHRPHLGCCQPGAVLRYLAPGTVLRDVRRCWATGRWT